MFDAADILVDRHPVIDGGLHHGDAGGGRAKAGEVPGAVNEHVERVGLPPGCAAASRAGDVFPGRVMIQRIAGPVERHIVRQAYRKLIVRHRHNTACRTVDDRDRTAPVALPGHAPVAQPPVRQALADSLLLQPSDRGSFGGIDVQPVQEAGVERGSRPDISLIPDGETGRIGVRRQHHGGYVQVVFAGEFKVALVVRRAAEDRAGAVFHQHEVSDPDRVGSALDERVGDTQAGVVAKFLAGLDGGFRGAAAAAVGDEFFCNRVARGGCGGQGMFRRDGQERHSVQGIGAGGVDLDGIGAAGAAGVDQGERESGALAAADPVGLHQPHPFRPAVELAQRIQQLRRVFGDAEKPLAELPLFHRRPGAPAFAVDHLLVCQHGALRSTRPARRKSRNSFCWWR